MFPQIVALFPPNSVSPEETARQNAIIHEIAEERKSK